MLTFEQTSVSRSVRKLLSSRHFHMLWLSKIEHLTIPVIQVNKSYMPNQHLVKRWHHTRTVHLQNGSSNRYSWCNPSKKRDRICSIEDCSHARWERPGAHTWPSSCLDRRRGGSNHDRSDNSCRRHDNMVGEWARMDEYSEETDSSKAINRPSSKVNEWIHSIRTAAFFELDDRRRPILVSRR